MINVSFIKTIKHKELTLHKNISTMNNAGKSASPIKFTIHLIAILMVLMWGVSFVSTKHLLNSGLNPSQIYVIRFGIAYLCLLAVTFKKLRVKSIKDELLFLFCGLTGGSIYFITENIALEHTLVSNVGLIITTAPLLTALVSKIFYRNEKIGKG